jgi:hypothetical protein
LQLYFYNILFIYLLQCKKTFDSHWRPLKNKPIGRSGHALFTPALGRKPEEVIASDLVASGFPADVSEGGVNLAIPLVAAVEYVYPRRKLSTAGEY